MTVRAPGSAHRAAAARAGGFTITELAVVVSLGLLLVLALHRTILGQRRYYAAQQSAAQRHETLRIASAILSSALREANVPRGDVVILAPGRVRARSPLGLGFVCGTDGATRVGLVRVEGRWAAAVGDSVLIHRAAGWDARRVTAIGGPVTAVPCVTAGGSVPTLDAAVADARVGSVARAFRSQIYEIAASGTDYWLYRVDGAQRDLLAGPLDGATGFQLWYESALGGVLPSAVGAERIGFRLIARALDPPLGASPRRDTLTLSFTGRNR